MPTALSLANALNLPAKKRGRNLINHNTLLAYSDRVFFLYLLEPTSLLQVNWNKKAKEDGAILPKKGKMAFKN